MPFTAEQERNLQQASDSLMEQMRGKVPDLNSVKAMQMLANVMMSGLQQAFAEETEEHRDSVEQAVMGAAFVAAIGRDESIQPFEYIKRMTSALFADADEAYNAKMELYSDAMKCAEAGKNVTPIDTKGMLTTDEEGEE